MGSWERLDKVHEMKRGNRDSSMSLSQILGRDGKHGNGRETSLQEKKKEVIDAPFSSNTHSDRRYVYYYIIIHGDTRGW